MFTRSYTLPAHVSEETQPVIELSHELGAFALATAFREAALNFMNCSEEWGKAELAMWLMGAYRRCTAYGRTRADIDSNAPLMVREIDARFVPRVLDVARTSVLEVLRDELSTRNIGCFAFEMIDAEFVVPCKDARGVDGWLPTNAPRRLAERILSLFAADYLTRPREFELELSVCNRCQRIDFDPSSHRRGICHRHQSGLFSPNAHCPTLSQFPEGA